MNWSNYSAAPNETLLVRRRLLQLGSYSLIGTVLFGGSAWAQAGAAFPGVMAIEGGHKPTYLPDKGSKDPVAHSVAENLFWNEQLLEHTAFFLMLLPGPELAPVRAEVEKFKGIFTERLQASKSAKLDAGSLATFNKTSADHAMHFADFKRKQRDAQASGKLRSLVWPTFFDHTAREADYFAERLGRLSAGETDVDRGRAVEFWTSIMGEHADFVAHLLDPEERELVQKAMDASKGFGAVNSAKALSATEALIDFKVAAEKGIDAGKIKSIIHPTLADHVRREALKAADELRRVA